MLPDLSGTLWMRLRNLLPTKIRPPFPGFKLCLRNIFNVMVVRVEDECPNVICASRHTGVHFFDVSTAKSGLRMVCFVHFDLEMCFAPQRRAIFHLSSGQLAPHQPL